MISKRLFNNSIHQRFLAVALLPLLLITSLLSFYTINARWSDLSQSLNQSGELTSDYLATIFRLCSLLKNYSAIVSYSSVGNAPTRCSWCRLSGQR